MAESYSLNPNSGVLETVRGEPIHVHRGAAPLPAHVRTSGLAHAVQPGAARVGGLARTQVLRLVTW